jgi:hypothetical protein
MYPFLDTPISFGNQKMTASLIEKRTAKIHTYTQMECVAVKKIEIIKQLSYWYLCMLSSAVEKNMNSLKIMTKVIFETN